MEPLCVNQAVLSGRATDLPRLSHINHGVHYYIFPLEVQRLSGAADVLNVVAAQQTLEACPVVADGYYTATGEVRSFNNRSGVGSRLVITFFAKSLSPARDEPQNLLKLSGTLCKPTTLRRTPLGREICDLLLAVNRSYGRSDYLPCIAWGALARACARLGTGDTLALTGRLQSRKYRKVLAEGEEERTAYEISVLTLEDPGS